MAASTIPPRHDVLSLRDAVDHLLADRWISPGNLLTWTRLGLPYLPVAVYESADQLLVRALVPGVKPDDIDLTYRHGVLTLRTRTDPPDVEAGMTCHRNEIDAGEAIRQIELPRGVDVERAVTNLENGILTIRLPTLHEEQARRIGVSTTRP